MEGLLMAIVPIIIGIIGYAVMSAAVRVPGNALQQKFVDLGTLKGKSLSEITSVVGSPNSVSTMAGGTKLCQWMATGYHISLLFDENDICLGVNHETSV